jgi:hypothetical protein
MAMDENRLADDLLFGAAEIAAEVYGDPRKRSRVYHNRDKWPIFYIGPMLCARRSSLRKHIAEQERQAVAAQAGGAVSGTGTAETTTA